MKVDLIETMSRICYHAQEDVCDPEYHDADFCVRESAFSVTSYVIACLLAKYTFNGHGGVESEIVLAQMIDTSLNEFGYMLKSLDEWMEIINAIVHSLGGLKNE